ncbi:phosphoethanolamine--lipid A transferase [Rheinheimera metallidurans]|uniref:phosphoethanolamine transferase n=1 Tax=Rheinheimera metallidurans TaxID=2925781 RepID=UPI003001D542
MSADTLSVTTAPARPYKRPVVSSLLTNIAVAALLTLAFNQSFIHSIWPLGDSSLTLVLVSLLFLLNLFICQLFGVGRLQKTWLIGLLLLSTGCQYFMLQYGMLMDKSMLLNALETDSHEAYGLFNWAMLPYFTGYFVLPSLLIIWTKHHKVGSKRTVLRYSLAMLSIVAMIAVLVITQYQSFSSLFREHRYLKHQAVPFNILNAVIGTLHDKTAVPTSQSFVHHGEDAQVILGTGKPQLVIMVLGETVRADHLGINGYSRSTTPRIAKQNIVNFGAIDSCGTATAVSVPCMFSYLNRENYNEALAKNSDNLLDILKRSGVKVMWRNNNSGCKSMCDRVEQDQSFARDANCTAGECSDLVLLNGLKQKLLAEKSAATPIFIVLHQQGNHGPEYYKRSTATQKQFAPECESNLLNQCQTEHIINAYDNAILATDDLLNATIELLKELSTEFDTSMLYVSDHGESLGENGVYLHGLPYWMAPEAQTKVPLLMWFSAETIKNTALKTDCLQQNAAQAGSHDMVFDSVLSWLRIESGAIRPTQNIFHGCYSTA